MDVGTWSQGKMKFVADRRRIKQGKITHGKADRANSKILHAESLLATFFDTFYAE